MVHVGIAGWSIRKEHLALFATDGTHLQRYASRFDAVEINSSFYQSHQRQTYERWATSVPATFRFAVKAPKLLTHEYCLEETGELLAEFVHEIGGLGKKLGCVLVQLPPSLAYDPRTVETFFAALRARYRGPLVCEPRHPTWFTGAADRRLEAHGVGRVGADPPCAENGGEPAASTRVIGSTARRRCTTRAIQRRISAISFGKSPPSVGRRCGASSTTRHAAPPC